MVIITQAEVMLIENLKEVVFIQALKNIRKLGVSPRSSRYLPGRIDTTCICGMTWRSRNSTQLRTQAIRWLTRSTPCYRLQIKLIHDHKLKMLSIKIMPKYFYPELMESAPTDMDELAKVEYVDIISYWYLKTHVKRIPRLLRRLKHD